MKKAIVLLLALAVLGGAVFAEDAALAVSGYVNTGLKLVNYTDATNLQLYSDDWLAGPGNFAYIDVTLSGEMSGFEVTFIGDSAVGVTVDTAYGWIMPVAGLKLFAGNYYSGAFDGVDDDSNDYFASEGISATYSISGFTAGAGVVLDKTAANKGDLVFGAAYKMDDVVSIRFSALTDAKELNKMSASASLLAVPGLTVKGGYLSEGMATTANSWLDLTVGYKVSDALSAQVVAYDYLDKEFFTVTPRVTYTVSPTLAAYGQVAIVTEGKAAAVDYATIKPRVRVTYTPDAASKLYGQVEYNTELETTTFLLQYVFSF